MTTVRNTNADQEEMSPPHGRPKEGSLPLRPKARSAEGAHQTRPWVLGTSIDRVDGPAKVTGAARYAAEYRVPDLAYGVVISSPIAKGMIARIDAAAALAIEGVQQVFTHENAPALPESGRDYHDPVAPTGTPFRPLQSAAILWSGQPVALVIADTLEIARYAATLVRIDYEQHPHATDLAIERKRARQPKDENGAPAPSQQPRGDAAAAFNASEVRTDAEYGVPFEHHNPTECHATTVVWLGDGRIDLFDKTQGPLVTHDYVCAVFAMSKDAVHAVSSYVGGAFGSGLRPQYQLFLAVLAARELKRSVRVSLTRAQMFSFGYRPHTLQRIALGATREGMLTSIRNDAIANTSQFEDFTETVVDWASVLYHCDNTAFSHKLASLDLYTPQDMRAPGGTTGVYALECAIDELAHQAGIDPLQMRLINASVRDENVDKPFSSKELVQCFRQGADRFGWTKRNHQPRSMREGRELIGWGLATGVWGAYFRKADARAIINADGKLEVSSATCDIGCGTYTIMTQIAAETLGLPLADVTFKLGDSNFPEAPLEGGSWTAASVGSAVRKACEALREKLLDAAKRGTHSSFADAQPEDVLFLDGNIVLEHDRSVTLSIEDAIHNTGSASLEVTVSSVPDKKTQEPYARFAHSAIFAEVKVDEDFGTIRVTRVVNAVAAGRILNAKTAASQVMGGVVWGIGMALEEETLLDHHLGRFMNHSYAEYHVPVNADIHGIDVIFVEEHDTIVNPLGVKGLGEIGIVGTAAAIANAVFHATGKRIRDLPITLDKVFA